MCTGERRRTVPSLKFKRLRVAIVDDEPAVRRALERLMRVAGYEVRSFASGGDFLAGTQADPPDCVVLDVHMPGMGGFDVQETLRDRGSAVPVVVITGYDCAEARDEAMACGAYACLCKPVDGPALIDTIQRATSAAAR
jgi:FixJ family two-component response regulator